MFKNSDKKITINMKTSIAHCNNKDNPIIIDSSNIIYLDFGTVLDGKTVKYSVEIFKVKGSSGEISIPVDCNLKGFNSSVVKVTKRDSSNFEPGEEYRVSIKESLKSINGNPLSNNSIYFTVNYDFDLSNEIIKWLDLERKIVVCISDIHLGIDDSFSELKKNKKSLQLFLSSLRYSPNIKELVLAGDIFDHWTVPGNYKMSSVKSPLDFLKAIVENNKDIINTLNGIIKDNNIKVTYVPGNHDMIFTRDHIDIILPGIYQARDGQGLGIYTPIDFPKAIIEHSHRYDFYCAPDPISNRKVAPGSIIPPGYFFGRISTTSHFEGKRLKISDASEVHDSIESESDHLAYLYWAVWILSLSQLPLKSSFDERFINTNLEGLEGVYSINDLLPFQLTHNGPVHFNIFNNIQDSWHQREELNQVNIKVNTEEAITMNLFKGPIDSTIKQILNRDILNKYFDDMAYSQYFNNPKSNKRIVIFGHTHDPKLIPFTTNTGKRAVYGNTGTWIDDGELKDRNMTFIILIPPKEEGILPSFINLYKYTSDGKSILIEGQAIVDN